MNFKTNSTSSLTYTVIPLCFVNSRYILNSGIINLWFQLCMKHTQHLKKNKLCCNYYFVQLQDQVYPLSITTQHTFQSWPGGFYLAYRLFLLLCILFEMRHVYLVENRPEKLKLYVVLAIFYILWFCYLPGIVFVAALINPVLKYKLVLSFVLTFDFLANFGMVLLFVPRWSKLFFQFDSHLNALQESPYKSLKSFRYGSSENTPNVV